MFRGIPAAEHSSFFLGDDNQYEFWKRGIQGGGCRWTSESISS
jgi:hypothetical protein